MNSIKLVKINESNIDYDLIYEWNLKPFVYEWFEQRRLTKEEIIEKYSNKLNNSNQTLLYIVDNQKIIGYVQYYETDCERDYFKNQKVYEYDLFIGEEDYLDRGVGKEAIALINDTIFKKEKPDSIILRPCTRNRRACVCYEKCGFELIENYNGKDTLGNSEIFSIYRINR